ncbi:MAG TPA: (2Fe-2S)-binding protein [Casimicrobium huifangae]|jgi:bacterioferritin-associated ferredoxin|uniref:(2Fe-2S)-binding protein n=1 Tax=Casimicrobium huifangae TaxID=2591109 RepID=UPI0012EC3D24|nr:(2Fe-2S)-binding protein [Casimicrobium huifangae]HQA35023.1 (2Fe-2S)-binding protein [Casimicrobium huifangae]HQD66865.1 (2Fe-2S)-binding protein [Casimicrobium huifangae]
MIVCICHGINDRTLRKAVDDGASTMSDLVSATGVSTCCGCCADCAREVLDEALAERLPLAA